MGVKLVMGVIVWLSMTIMPSFAEENPFGLPSCWAKIQDCTTNAIEPGQESTASYAICCPVIKPQVANTTCFCSIKDYIHNIPDAQPAVLASQFELVANKALADCKIDSSFDQLCNGVSKEESTQSSSESMKNGATKIASVAFFPSVLFVWTINSI